MRVWNRGREYRLEISVDDSQIVHVIQASEYSRQLFAREVGG